MKSTTNSHVENRVVKQFKTSTVKTKKSEALGLFDLFVNEVKDVYWAEKALLKAIPKMIKKTSSEELEEALTGHLEVTKEHVVMLEEVFAAIDQKPDAIKCIGMEGLLKEADQVMDVTEMGMVRNAAIIASAMKVEHFEIATYGTLCFFAKTLGENFAADSFHKILEQEKEANEKLSEILESMKLETDDMVDYEDESVF